MPSFSSTELGGGRARTSRPAASTTAVLSRAPRRDSPTRRCRCRPCTRSWTRAGSRWPARLRSSCRTRSARLTGFRPSRRVGDHRRHVRVGRAGRRGPGDGQRPARRRGDLGDLVAVVGERLGAAERVGDRGDPVHPRAERLGEGVDGVVLVGQREPARRRPWPGSRTGRAAAEYAPSAFRPNPTSSPSG